MFTKVWGSELWHLLHMFAHTYPDEPTEERQESMRLFLKHLAPNLPCFGCGMHCHDYFREFPPDVSSKDALVDYFFTFHNAVNKRTGKREYTKDEALQALMEHSFQTKDWSLIAKAEVQRKEDAKAFNVLQEKFDLLNSTVSQEQDDFTTFEIVVMTLLTVMLIFLLIALLF